MSRESTDTDRRAFLALGLGAAVLPSRALAAPAVADADPVLSAILDRPMTAAALHDRVGRRTAALRQEHVLRVRRWALLFPGEARKLLATVADDVAGRLILPGTGNKPYDVGTPPKWSANPLHANEYVATLVRMQHWPRLLRAWVLTGDDRFPARVVGEFDDFLASCPRPAIDGPISAFEPIGPWRALEVGLRMEQSWPVLFQLLAGTKWLPPERLARFFIATHQHGEVLATISPRLWPKAEHNHYLTESSGLLSTSALLPELREATAWREQGWREVNRCIRIQIGVGGGQHEGAPHYHNVVVRTLGKAAMVARSVGLTVSPEYRRQMAQAANYSLHAFRPSGTIVPWGDSDANATGYEGALWGAAVTGDWSAADVAARLVKPGDKPAMIGSVYWYDPTIVPGDGRHPGAVKRSVPDTSLWARENDQFMARTDWTPQALSVFFGCHSPVFNGHSHADPASFDFTAFGRPLVVDPGRYTYVEGVDRRHFKSAKWHNTLTVDDREPFDYVDGYTFGPQRRGVVTRAFSAPGLVGAECRNENFAPALHRRAVALVRGNVLLVLDLVEGVAVSSDIQRWFHLDSQVVAWSDRYRCHVTADSDRPNVAVHADAGTRGSIEEGLVSDLIDVARPSRRVRLSTPGSASQLLATVIEPLAPGASPGCHVVSTGKDRDTDRWTAIISLDGRVTTFQWRPETSLLMI